jgi:hypothetical protein
MRLGMSTRREIYQAHYRRYQQAKKAGEGKILDELAGTTGLNRDHRAHVPARYGKKRTGEREGKEAVPEVRRPRKERGPVKGGGRPPKYQGKAFVAPLTRIWEDHGRPCGKLFAALIRGMIDFLVASKDSDYGITGGLKALLVSISGAQIDRLLAPARKALELRGVSTTRAASTSLRSQVPVQTHFDRKTVKPGDFAFDTVAHCGGVRDGSVLQDPDRNQPLFRVGRGAGPFEQREQVGGGCHRGHPEQSALSPDRGPL